MLAMIIFMAFYGISVCLILKAIEKANSENWEMEFKKQAKKREEERGKEKWKKN